MIYDQLSAKWLLTALPRSGIVCSEWPTRSGLSVPDHSALGSPHRCIQARGPRVTPAYTVRKEALIMRRAALLGLILTFSLIPLLAACSTSAIGGATTGGTTPPGPTPTPTPPSRATPATPPA